MYSARQKEMQDNTTVMQADLFRLSEQCTEKFTFKTDASND